MTTRPTIRVLLIEDSPTDADILSISLNEVASAAFAITWVESLADGLQQLSTYESAFDVVLLDLNLPDSYGLDTCAKAHNQSPGVPIIVLTGLDDEEGALAAMKVGAQDYLVKGTIDGKLLTRSIRYAIERQRSQDLQRQADERVRLVTSQLPAVIWTTDAALTFVAPTSQFLTRDSARGDVLGLNLRDVLTSSFASKDILQAHQQALAGQSSSIEVRWSRRTLLLHVEPLRDSVTRVIGTIGISLDVTEQKRMRDELSAARHVQQALFPKSAPVVPGFDLAGAVFPAEETAGDYFDFIPMQDGAMGIVVGDVTGHGLAPAMLMAELRAYLRAVLSHQSDVSKLLMDANEFLVSDMDENRYVTLFFARLDPQSRVLQFAAAGHWGYVLRGPDETLALKSTGLPLGLFDEAGIEPGLPFAMQPGDVLFIPTDGFQEAFGVDKKLFGIQRTLEVVRRNRHLSAAKIIEELRTEVCEFAQSQTHADDMTVVVVRCL